MSEEKSQPECMDNNQATEEKHDLDKSLSDSDSYKNGSNSSQIGVFGHHRIHRLEIVSLILSCIAIAIGVGIIFGMTAGFVLMKNEISSLKQEWKARDDALQKRIYNLELQQSQQCKQCNLTTHSSSRYDDQELRMKLDNIGATQTDMQSQLNTTQSTLSDQRQQIITLRQLTQENFTQIDSKIGGLGELVTNTSEQVSHLYVMRDDHRDQLSQINMNLTNFSTQLTHFNGNLNNLISAQEIQKTDIASLTSIMSTLESRVDVIDRRDTTKDSELEQKISQLNQHVQNDNVRVSNQLNTVDRRLDTLGRSGAAVYYPVCTVMTIGFSLVMIFAF